MRHVLSLLALVGCAETWSDHDENIAKESEVTSALHVGSGPVFVVSQESDSRYFINANVGFFRGDLIVHGYDWWLVSPTRGYLHVGSTAEDDSHLDMTFNKNQILPGEYWIQADAYVSNRPDPSVPSDPSDPPAPVYILSDTSNGFQIPLLPATPDVGVIPDGSSCPSASQKVSIFMDNEDRNAASKVTGWVGGTTVDGNRNTWFTFCRVDGTLFKSLSSSRSTSTDYAVLRLGAVCPPGSVEFFRKFDNEDGDNRNTWTGNISPNTTFGDTTLNFCLFKGNGTVASDLPDLGFSYGVFAAPAFSHASQRGVIDTDDEDNNANGYSDPDPNDALLLQAAQEIVVGPGNPNTKLYTAKRVECGDGLCSPGENPTNCARDCDVCGNGACRGNETPFTCWQDCGYCGDGVCRPNEGPGTCPKDCFVACPSGETSRTDPPACS